MLYSESNRTVRISEGHTTTSYCTAAVLKHFFVRGALQTVKKYLRNPSPKKKNSGISMISFSDRIQKHEFIIRPLKLFLGTTVQIISYAYRARLKTPEMFTVIVLPKSPRTNTVRFRRARPKSLSPNPRGPSGNRRRVKLTGKTVYR